MKSHHLLIAPLLALLIATAGCPVPEDGEDGGSPDASADAGRDAGTDGGGTDGGATDGGDTDGGVTDGGSDGGGSDGGAADGGGTDGGVTDGGSDGGTDGGSTASADELYWREILAGRVDATVGVQALAERGGFPLAVEAGFLFVRLDDGAGPYDLAGDFEGWSGLPMQRSGELWWLTVPIASPDGALYKFVDGAGTFEADPLARRYGHDGFGEFSLVRASAAHLERLRASGDASVPERWVRLRVPAEPVARHLYVQDGQNLFDPQSIWGGWQLDQSVGAGTLVVGIDNTVDRMNEYTQVFDDGVGTGGGADAYTDWVVGSLLPQVEARYGGAPRRGAMGSSLGGLVSLHLWMRHPARFSFVASLSGTMSWGSIGSHTGETLIERLAGRAPDGTILFLDSGGGPGSGCVDTDADGIQDDSPDSADNYCANRQLADQLAADGWTWDSDLFHWWEQDAPHNEQAWAARVHRPLALFEAP